VTVRKTKRVAPRRKTRVDIGTVQTLSSDKKAGLIVPLDGSTPAFFDLSDEETLQDEVDAELRVGQIVQFVRDEAPGGDYRARRITVLDEATS
jgi:cold shock CspA family protein